MLRDRLSPHVRVVGIGLAVYSMMTKNEFVIVVFLVPVLPACTEPKSEDTFEFRSVSEPPEDYAGNGDIEIHQGTDDEIPDEIIWDVMGGTVLRQVEPGVFEERINVEGEVMQDVEEPAWTAPVCVVDEVEHPSGEVFELVSSTDGVLFTLWGRFVFAGQHALPDEPNVEEDPTLAAQVAFSFEGSHIYGGPWWDGTVLTTASEEIQDASPERRLLLAALVAGDCGSQSIP